jgi:hypothetical protein
MARPCVTPTARHSARHEDRSTAGRAYGATAWTECRIEHGPLGVGQVHAVEYDWDLTYVSDRPSYL